MSADGRDSDRHVDADGRPQGGAPDGRIVVADSRQGGSQKKGEER